MTLANDCNSTTGYAVLISLSLSLFRSRGLIRLNILKYNAISISSGVSSSKCFSPLAVLDTIGTIVHGTIRHVKTRFSRRTVKSRLVRKKWKRRILRGSSTFHLSIHFLRPSLARGIFSLPDYLIRTRDYGSAKNGKVGRTRRLRLSAPSLAVFFSRLFFWRQEHRDIHLLRYLSVYCELILIATFFSDSTSE